ncbi:hypothetical protein [Rhodoferax sp.]|uniref:hypothetical protein n=1 Tax=Rhodoferax sp. TaxID=50421 RepID=UPI00274EB233|nr:hypothetical protein [Rhodoferax sp.]
MSFLNQLKFQARALQTEQSTDKARAEANTQQTEWAAKTAWQYLSELAKHLDVLKPDGPALSLDGKTPWPSMCLTDFRVDARKKKLRDQEVFDYVAMGWNVVPREGPVQNANVSANFPPGLQRIESRIAAGTVKHERVEVRHPEKNTLQAFRFDYKTEARGTITITADHGQASLGFRLANVRALEVVSIAFPADEVRYDLMDELAKLIVGEASAFLP